MCRDVSVSTQWELEIWETDGCDEFKKKTENFNKEYVTGMGGYSTRYTT